MTSCKKRSVVKEARHAWEVQSRKKGKWFLSDLMKVYGRRSSERGWRRPLQGEGAGVDGQKG